MNLKEKPAAKSRYRAAWLGFFAGAATQFVSSLALVALSVVFDHAWANAMGTPYVPTSEIPNANTPLWLSLQILGMFAALLSGIASARWSPGKSWSATILLSVLAVLFAVFAQFPATHSPVRIALWALGTPFGIVFGALLYRRRERAA